MHQEYRSKLSVAEEMLHRVYESVAVGLEDVDEEVVKILREAKSGVVVERIELVERQLRFLPEDFGKLHGLLVLNLSRNELEVTFNYSFIF